MQSKKEKTAMLLRRLPERDKKLMRSALSFALYEGQYDQGEIDRLGRFIDLLSPTPRGARATFQVNLEKGTITIMVNARRNPDMDAELTSYCERHNLEVDDWYVKDTRSDFDGAVTTALCKHRPTEQKAEKQRKSVKKTKEDLMREKIAQMGPQKALEFMQAEMKKRAGGS